MSFATFLDWESASRDSIDFKRRYVHMTGDLIAGLMLSQIVYWHLPDGNGESKLRIVRDGKRWLAKRAEDWWDECCISPKQAKRALGILVDLGIVEKAVFRFGGNPTTHVRIDEDVFMECWQNVGANGNVPKGQNGNSGQMEMSQRDKTKRTKGTIHITESTTQNTNRNVDDEKSSSANTHDSASDLATSSKPKQSTKKNGFIAPKNRIKSFQRDPSNGAKQAARKLHDTLKKNRRIMRMPDLRKWALAIDEFLDECDADDCRQRFKDVLLWFCENLKTYEFMPDVRAAKTFCERFDQIAGHKLRFENDQRRDGERYGPVGVEWNENEEEELAAAASADNGLPDGAYPWREDEED